MPIEAKEILDYLETTEVESLDDFKQKFSEKYVKDDPQAVKDRKGLYSGVTGAYNEANKGAYKRVWKENGYEISNDELKDRNINEILSDHLPKQVKSLTTKIATLEEALSSGKGSSADIEKVKTEYETKIQQLVQQHDKLFGEHESFKQTVAQKEAQEKINKYHDEEWTKFGFSQTVDPYAKKGFMGDTHGEFQTKIFDDGIFPVDKNGNRIPDPARAHGWKSLSQIAIERADEAEKNGTRLRTKVEHGKAQEVKKTFSFKADENKDQPQGRKLNTGTRVKSAA